jgi:hypothetical protein
MDIYQSTYSYIDSKEIKASSARTFEVKANGQLRLENSKDLIIFNHIAQSGGVQLNDVFCRDSKESGYKFLIPDFDTYHNADFYKDGKYFISGHFLNGVDEFIKTIPSIYFTVLRDPVSQIISFLTSKDDFCTSSAEAVWDRVEKKLEFWEHEVGHINLQSFEIAVNYQDKRFKSKPETETIPIHFYKNYIGLDQVMLLNKARENIAEKYLMVGITELYEETLFLLYARLGCKRISLWRPGVFSFWRPRRFEIPIFIEEKIKKLTEADHALYIESRKILEKDFFSANFGNEFAHYKLLSRNHELRLFSEYSERIELGRVLSTINKDKARFKEEISHVIEFRDSIDALIDQGLQLSVLIKNAKKFIRLVEKIILGRIGAP